MELRRRGGGRITVLYKSLTNIDFKTLYMLEWEKDLAQEWDFGDLA